MPSKERRDLALRFLDVCNACDQARCDQAVEGDLVIVVHSGMTEYR